MICFRPLQWPEDQEHFAAFDASYVTDRVYRLDISDRMAKLTEDCVDSPVHKSYPLADELRAIATFDWTQVATAADAIVGLAAMSVENWNNRAQLRHLYVTQATYRATGLPGRGVKGL